jgi:hypothetical protein
MMRMLMKKLLLYLALAALVLAPGLVTGCGKVVTGSGETVTWEMVYTDFAKIDAGSSFNLTITRSDNFTVLIIIDKNLNEYLSINQRGDTLHIGLEPNNIYTNTRQEAVVTLPDLRRLELSGAAKATVSGFSTTHSVDYELSGASQATLAGIKAGDTSLKLSGASQASGGMTMNKGDFSLSGASKLELHGSASQIKLNGSGASKFSLEDFPVTDASISLSGASSAVIKLDGRIDLDLSGASDVEYIGNPKLGSINMSGGSTVNQRK